MSSLFRRLWCAIGRESRLGSKLLITADSGRTILDAQIGAWTPGTAASQQPRPHAIAAIHHAAPHAPQRRHGDAADRLWAVSSQRRTKLTRCVADAIKAGYAHFDGAAFYDNEREAGLSLTEECWYTTKVWTTDSTFEDAVASVKRSRAELGT